MSVSVNLFAAYDGYLTNKKLKKLKSAISVAENLIFHC